MVETYKSSKICPSCGSVDKIYRSRARNEFERFINGTRILSMYRCHECNWRGIRFRKIVIDIKITQIIRFILILFITYFTISFILKQAFKIVFFK